MGRHPSGLIKINGRIDLQILRPVLETAKGLKRVVRLH